MLPLSISRNRKADREKQVHNQAVQRAFERKAIREFVKGASINYVWGRELSAWAGGLLGNRAEGRASCNLRLLLLSRVIPSYPFLFYPVLLLSLSSPLIPSYPLLFPPVSSSSISGCHRGACILYSSNLSLSPLIILIILYHLLSSFTTSYHSFSYLTTSYV